MANLYDGDGAITAVLVDQVDGIEVWAGPDPLVSDLDEWRWRRSPERLRALDLERRSPADDGDGPDWDELELASRVVLRRPE